MSDNFLDDLDSEAKVSSVKAPSEKDSQRLNKAAQQFIDTDHEVSELESKLSEAKARRYELAHKTLPDLLSEIGQDLIGLPNSGEFGVDIVVEPYVKANIPKDWDSDKRGAAFDLLDRKGDGSLIKNLVSYQFDKGDHEKVKAMTSIVQSDEFTEMLRAKLGDEVNNLEIPSPIVDMTVPWQTLTSYLKDQLKRGTLVEDWMLEEDPPLDPIEMLGATVGSVAKIKPRKGK